MQVDWITLFKSDFTSQVFSNPVESENVLFWIKRFENGRMSQLTSSGNTRPLRSFEIYDSKLQTSDLISLSYKNKWTCTGVVERTRDQLGSNLLCSIHDPLGNSKEIGLIGYFAKDGGNNGFTPYLDENLYFSALMMFLEMLKEFSSWTDFNVKKPTIYKDVITNGVPSSIFKYIYKQNQESLEIKNQSFSKLNHSHWSVDVLKVLELLKDEAIKLLQISQINFAPTADWNIEELENNTYLIESDLWYSDNNNKVVYMIIKGVIAITGLEPFGYDHRLQSLELYKRFND